jgi:hypothetical protein
LANACYNFDHFLKFVVEQRKAYNATRRIIKKCRIAAWEASTAGVGMAVVFEVLAADCKLSPLIASVTMPKNEIFPDKKRSSIQTA